MRLWRELSLYTRLMLFVFLFIFLPFTFIGVSWYVKSAEVNEQNATRYSQLVINQIHDRLDDYFQELEQFTLPYVVHPLVQQFLKGDPEDRYELYKLSDQVFNTLFTNDLSGRNDIRNLSLVGKNKLVVSTVSAKQGLLAYEMYVDEESAQNFSIQGLRFANGTPVITITRELIDPATLTANGLLIMDINFRKISSIIGNKDEHDFASFWIADEEGQTIYHSDETKWLEKIEYLPEAYSPEFPFVEQYYTEDSQLLTYKKTENLGWFIGADISIKHLNGDLIQLRNVTVMYGVLLVTLAIIVFGAFSMSLTRSLLILQRTMVQAEKGNFNVQAPKSHNVQINSLYRAFNKMVSEIKRLIKVEHVAQLRKKEMEIKQMESTLMIMQSQINPHFLFNALEVINSYAIEHQLYSVSQMVAGIAKMFRYNVGNPQKTVTLHDELEHVNTFLKIQKARYRDLEVTIDVDSRWINQVTTVRLVLHPIVENVFEHGYEAHGLRPSTVKIDGQLRNNKVVLTVEDEGGGMERSKMMEYNQLFQHVTETEVVYKYRHLKDSSIGLWNVHSRLLLTFGKGYGLYIRKSDELGTKIEISLPWRNEDA